VFNSSNDFDRWFLISEIVSTLISFWKKDMKLSVVKSLLGSPIYCWYTKLCFSKCEDRACKIIYDRKTKQSRRYVLIKKHQIITFLGSGPVSFELQVFFKTSFVNGFLYQFLNHFFQLSPVF
jgi:hypothetical protein